MKKHQSLAWMLGIALTGTIGMASCSSANEVSSDVVIDENGQAHVKPEFVISIPRSVIASTRMSDGVTQSAGTIQQFRGLDNIHLIPFANTPTSTSTKIADIMRLSHIQQLGGEGSTNYKVYADQPVPVGTRNFLLYAKAIDLSPEAALSDMSDKFKYGVLNVSNLSNDDYTTPGNTRFSLEPINTTVEKQVDDAVGKNIVEFLNDLANISVEDVAAPNDKWSTTEDVTLAPLYANFIQNSVGSSNSFALMLSHLYFSLAHVQSSSPAHPLAEAIKTKIQGVCASEPINGSPLSLTSSYAGYPTNIGLPDGAARLVWNVSGEQANTFTDITANYGSGNLIDITKYTYPAALWYYISSPIKASNDKKSEEYETAEDWNGVIDNVYANAGDEVKESTKSVALILPVQYGVGRIETTIKMGEGTYYDADGEEIIIGSGYTLKGFLVGGQNSAGFDFTPKGNEGYTIYDREVISNIVATPNTITGTANQTLALETRANQKVYVALELINGGEEFQGADGVIPAGGTFYMTAELDPTTASNYVEGTLDKIVLQDHVTKLTITIKNGNADGTGGGLGEATNGVPDLTSPGIEVGTSVDLIWQQGLDLNPSI